jgi:hypothetical protein
MICGHFSIPKHTLFLLTSLANRPDQHDFARLAEFLLGSLDLPSIALHHIRCPDDALQNTGHICNARTTSDQDDSIIVARMWRVAVRAVDIQRDCERRVLVGACDLRVQTRGKTFVNANEQLQRRCCVLSITVFERLKLDRVCNRKGMPDLVSKVVIIDGNTDHSDNPLGCSPIQIHWPGFHLTLLPTSINMRIQRSSRISTVAESPLPRLLDRRMIPMLRERRSTR